MVKPIANISKIRKFIFLKEVLVITVSAFGSPQMHIAMFLKRLVEKRNYISKEDLLELNSLCQILPGPTSTQTLTAIGFKIGGPSLAFLTLLIWILPAATIMTIFVLTVGMYPELELGKTFKYILPLSVGFVSYAAIKMFSVGKKDLLSLIITIAAAIVGSLILSPWVFPILIILGGGLSAWFGNHTYIPNTKPIINVNWSNFILFAAVLIFAALVGELTRGFEEISRPMLLFENTYRMGGLVFGGGNVLTPMIITEFVEMKSYLSIEDFQVGYGLLQGIPGPRFTIATFVNGMAMQNAGYGTLGQIVGCFMGTIAIFLPGTLLIFFVYPIWGQLKTYPIVRRSLDGILAAAVGLVFAAAFLLFRPVFNDPNQIIGVSLTIILVTFLLLYLTKIPSPILVVVAIVGGILFQ